MAANVSYLGRRVSNLLVEVPMGVTLLFSQGSHCAPRWYHDRTVRVTPEGEVTGFRSGFVAAGKVSDSYHGVIWEGTDQFRNLESKCMMV